MGEMVINLDGDLEVLINSKQLEPMEAVQIQTLREIQRLSLAAEEHKGSTSKVNFPFRIERR